MELSETIVQVCSTLEKHKIPYMIIGGYAVLFHGYTRFTEDIDITLGINISDSYKLLDILSELNCSALTENPDNFIKTTWVLPVEEKDRKIRIDFIFSFTDYETHAIQNSFPLNIDGKEVRFCSLDDLITLKIFSGRQRDLDDVKNIYLINKNKINLDYIYKWLEEFSNSSTKDYTKLFNKTIKE